jgi:hypothetical protein
MKSVLEYYQSAATIPVPTSCERYEKSEREFETRLDNLDGCLEGLNNEISLVWLNGEPHVFDAALDLKVKIEAVRWMLRVCKHLEEPARGRVFGTVGESLGKLEKTFESRPRPKRKAASWF